jgi:predicted DsbA family dithiol-disulfide isomerase
MIGLAQGAVSGSTSCDSESLPPSVLEAKKKKASLKVGIVSDVICPWCYVGKRNFERALAKVPEEVKVAVHWLPFELNPDMPVEGKDRRTYRSAKFGSWEHSQKLDAQVSGAAAQVGLRMRHDLMLRTPNTFKAHRLIWLAGQEGVQDAVVEALFRAYFVEGRDVGDVDVLTDIAVNSGGIARDRARAFFAGKDGVAEVSEAALSARRGGLSGVPTFVINGQSAFSGALRPELMLTHLLSAVTAS